MSQYEIAVVFDPGLEVDLEKATSRVEKIFKDNGAKVLKVDNWGKRKLAYTVKKHETGIYVIYSLEILAEGVQKIENLLNITDEVIRFLITKPDLVAIAKAEAAKADKAKKAAERGDKPESDTESEA